MRYFTKELYNLEQRQNAMYDLLTVTKQAETFSEDYFQRAYKYALKKHLALAKERSAKTADEVFPLDGSGEPFKILDKLTEEEITSVMSLEEYKAFRSKIEQDWKRARASYIPPVYDEAVSAEEFKENYERNLSLAPQFYPQIIDNVADVRVLALGRVSKENYHRLKDNDDRIKKVSNKADRDYKKAFKAMKNKIPDDVIRKYNFHDCKVLSADFVGNDFVVRFDNSYGFTKCTEVKYLNAKVIENEGVIGYSWLYDEFIENNSAVEYHAMLDGCGGLRYLTIGADGVEIK